MADKSAFKEAGISFEAALEMSQSLLEQMVTKSASENEIQQAIEALVCSENGTRGFFVIYLSDERSYADQPSPIVIEALKTSADLVSPLLVKNLAMSTAMAMMHRRNQNEELVQGSERVQRRSIELIRQLQLPELKAQAKALTESIDTNAGSYQSFLTRWKYDQEQRQAIRHSLEQAFHRD